MEETSPKVAGVPSSLSTEVAVITLRGSEILLAKSAEEGIHKDKWVIPSNSAQPNVSLNQTAINCLKQVGVTAEPGILLFVSEVLTENEHRIVLFVEGTYKEGDPVTIERYSVVRWVDVRKIYELQSDMPELTLDTLFKYSQILRARAAQKMQEQQGLINPCAEKVN